jgi:rhodanese-related sulfurtransferase
MEVSEARMLIDGLVDRSGDVSPRVLVLGEPGGAFTDALRGAEGDDEVVNGDWPSIQLPRRFDLVLVEPTPPIAPHELVAMVHCAVQHLVPGGVLATMLSADDDHLPASRFVLTEVASLSVGRGRLAVHRRTERHTIHDMVFEARSRIGRVIAVDLAGLLESDTAPRVLDTRTHTDRHRSGVIPGSMHVPRTVLEWHLDPFNGYRHPAAISYDEPIVVVCNGGYSSSLAAANLVDLGFEDVSDLIGGHRAWLAAGLPVEPADHSHLDL